MVDGRAMVLSLMASAMLAMPGFAHAGTPALRNRWPLYMVAGDCAATARSAAAALSNQCPLAACRGTGQTPAQYPATPHSPRSRCKQGGVHRPISTRAPPGAARKQAQ